MPLEYECYGCVDPALQARGLEAADPCVLTSRTGDFPPEFCVSTGRKCKWRKVRKDTAAKREESLVLMQLDTASQLLFGGGIPLGTFLKSNGLCTDKYLTLAKEHHINKKIIDAIEEELRK